MVRLLLILVAGVAVLVAAIGTYAVLGDAGGAIRGLQAFWDLPASDDPAPRVFEVREGQSASEVGRQLERQGLIRSALVFRVIVQTRGVESRIGRGVYVLRATMTTSQIVDVLVAGAMAPGRRMTVPEGWRAIQVARLLERIGAVKASEFMAVVADPGRIAPYHDLLENAPSLEGYLFPDSYELDTNPSAEAIAKRMVQEFDRRFTLELRRKAKALGLSLQQAVTLASIVEREAMLPEERRLISGVFHNRLRAGMPLQADPTVQYALASRDLDAAAAYDYWKQELTPDDLAVNSPYNTYLYRGLPPGPVCAPGLESLVAAVEPAQTDYLYFVARGDGGHAFARTLEEHLANIARMEKRRP